MKRKQSRAQEAGAHWGGHREFFDEGFISVPDVFLRSYQRLKPHGLSVGEAMFVIQLMATPAALTPSYRSLASRMGVTDKMVRRYAANLELKGYLLRRTRSGKTNLFDLTPLFVALQNHISDGRK